MNKNGGGLEEEDESSELKIAEKEWSKTEDEITKVTVCGSC